MKQFTFSLQLCFGTLSCAFLYVWYQCMNIPHRFTHPLTDRYFESKFGYVLISIFAHNSWFAHGETPLRVYPRSEACQVSRHNALIDKHTSFNKWFMFILVSCADSFVSFTFLKGTMKQMFWIIVPCFNGVLKDIFWVLKKKALKIDSHLATGIHFQKCRSDYQILQLKVFQLNWHPMTTK